MQLTRDSRALAEPLVEPNLELSSDLANAEKVCCKYDQYSNDAKQRSERPGAPPRGFDRDTDCPTRLAPGATASCCLEPKAVRPRGKGGVAGESLVASDVVPAFIQPLQFVAVAIGFGAAET